MAMAEEVRSKSTVEVLKPFYERATAAEERLAQLEDRLAQLETLHGIKKGDSTNECKEVSSVAKEFQAKLEVAHAELISEREKVCPFLGHIVLMASLNVSIL
ncbi:hypothetical protein AXF42_Ash008603 [Apostasia shenzhenica]|uniref:Uncharacterized protein n=1 Tax=Apostasia shenzhenica TaxID=1088818 RepID=A0A2I0B1X2_9ASPA|nr:hypothetical protein AXF42_Ash008603 [Apostasia shenzhenica]